MVYPRLVFFLFQQDTPFLLLFSYTTNKHSSFHTSGCHSFGGGKFSNFLIGEHSVVSTATKNVSLAPRSSRFVFEG